MVVAMSGSVWVALDLADASERILGVFETEDAARHALEEAAAWAGAVEQWPVEGAAAL